MRVIGQSGDWISSEAKWIRYVLSLTALEATYDRASWQLFVGRRLPRPKARATRLERNSARVRATPRSRSEKWSMYSKLPTNGFQGFVGRMMDRRAFHHQVMLRLTRPVSPSDSAVCYTSNQPFREECLNTNRITSTPINAMAVRFFPAGASPVLNASYSPE